MEVFNTSRIHIINHIAQLTFTNTYFAPFQSLTPEGLTYDKIKAFASSLVQRTSSALFFQQFKCSFFFGLLVTTIYTIGVLIFSEVLNFVLEGS